MVIDSIVFSVGLPGLKCMKLGTNLVLISMYVFFQLQYMKIFRVQQSVLLIE